VRACRDAGISVRVISARTTDDARTALARARPSIVIVDSIAIPIAAPLVTWMHRVLEARVIALMLMPSSARGTRTVLRGADRVVALSDHLARALVRIGVRRSSVSVIPPGRDGVERARRRVAANGQLRALAVANWSPAKGIATLVAAVAQVPDVRLDLVGDVGRGAFADAVVARIRANGLADRVVVHGALAGRALARRYADADVFVLPTEREGYGIVFAEALDQGLPVIAADAGPVPDIVRGAGLLVPPRRVRPLADALRVMRDRRVRSRLAYAARKRARDLPSWSATGAAFVALIRDVMRSSVAG
jgi:glycosyltransferase involved in cell wall biosynthesis